MARYTGGWIKLYRKILDNEIFDDAPTLAIFVLLLLWANRKPGTKILNGQRVTVQRGQVATSSENLARKLKLDRKLVERRLQRLEADRAIVQQVSNHGRVISIVNYERYQRKNSDVSNGTGSERPANDQDVSHGRPHSGEEKKGENKRDNNPQRVGAHARNDPSGGGINVEVLRLRATKILSRAAGAVRRGYDDAEARKFVGADGWRVLMVRYPDWNEFRKAYRATYEKSSPSITEGQFRDAIAAELIDPEQAEPPIPDELGRDLNC